MRFIIDLTAQQHQAYDHTYNHKLQGRMYNALKGTKFDEVHDSSDFVKMSYSNPFPVKTYEEGDGAHLLVASPDDEMLATIAADILDNKQLNLGNLQFAIDDIRPVDPTVGSPGESGSLITSTGVCIRIPERVFEQYGIESDESSEFWVPEHGMDAFKSGILSGLDRRSKAVYGDKIPVPSERDVDLFDSYELVSTYGKPLTVAKGETHTYVLNKWKFKYTVADNTHQKHLDMILDTGIGERNALGLGFVNKQQ